MRTALVSPIVVLALAACSASVTQPTVDNVLLLPKKSAYSAGETVSADLVNHSDKQLGYGACSIQLQVLKAGAWFPIGREDVPCILVLYVLDAGATRETQFRLDPSLQPGIYRLRQAILPATNPPQRYIYSSEFTVARAP